MVVIQEICSTQCRVDSSMVVGVLQGRGIDHIIVGAMGVLEEVRAMGELEEVEVDEVGIDRVPVGRTGERQVGEVTDQTEEDEDEPNYMLETFSHQIEYFYIIIFKCYYFS